jgi:hypothetical protein
MWKLCCAVVVLFAFVGVTLADEFNAVILNVKDGKVTYTLKGDSKRSLPVAEGVKVAKVKFVAGKPTAGEPVADGLGNKMFTTASAGVPVILVTSDDGKITAILLRAARKKPAD